MESSLSKQRSTVLPAQALAALRRAIGAEAGALAAIQAMQTAGYRAGELFFDELAESLGSSSTGVGEGAFFRTLSEFLRARGWGALRLSDPHPGVGLLSSRDWAEGGGSEEGEPSCDFSAGMLSAMLTQAAGRPVAVLHTTCRSRGDGECSFAFGSPPTIHDLYGLLLEDRTFESALEEL